MTHLARQVKPKDFFDFDLIFAMDKSNFENLKRICPDAEKLKKLHLLLEKSEVPDPYHGGSSVFEHVIDLLESAVPQVLNKFFSR